MTDTSEELDRLRKRLTAIDRQVLELVAERQRIVAEIGRSKRSQGLPTRDYRREREVVEHAREAALELQLQPDLAESIVRALIRTSLEKQEAERLAASGRANVRALVFGGAGRMGRWLSDFLASQGFSVSIVDPGAATGEAPYPQAGRWQEDRDQWDLIALAAPIQVTRDLLAVIERVRPAGLVFDVSSLKSPLRGALRGLADAGLKVTSLHPMFGPDTRLLSGRHVILVDVGVPAANEEARRLFEPTMAEIVEMSLEDHDRLISYVLGLSHALNIAFFTALRESGEAAEQLARLSSTTFDAQLNVARNVANDNAPMYFEIQSLNDYRLAPIRALGEAVERLRTMIVTGDEAGFVRLMTLGREYLAKRPQWQQE